MNDSVFTSSLEAVRITVSVMSLSVCLCVCVCPLVSLKPHGRTLPNCLCTLTVDAVRSSFGGVRIGLSYVLPVLWFVDDVMFSHNVPCGASYK